MFLLEPERTQFDLSWRMFGIDVRVHPMFWLVSALLGWPANEEVRLQFLAVWIVCVFVSILVHELGHVFAGRAFGSDGHIVLYSFGGLAIGSSNQARRWQRNLVYFAGPLAGFLLLAVVLATVFALLPNDLPRLIVRDPIGYLYIPSVYMEHAGWNRLVREAVNDLIWVNLFWGLLNLLPIWPLDGGRISRETLEWASPRQGAQTALLISGILAAALALNSLVAAGRDSGRGFIPYLPAGGWPTVIMFGLLAVSSFQLYQVEGNRRRYGSDDSAPWERGDDDWKRPRNYWER